jgi:hypothetical protein
VVFKLLASAPFTLLKYEGDKELYYDATPINTYHVRGELKNI